MKHKILAPTVLIILFVSLSLIVRASETETILPLADTYVADWEVTKPHGDREYIEVSEYTSGLSIAFLMFDISKVSHVLNASSEVKLRLYCFEVASPHIIGVYWCVNNTWSEEDLTFVSLSRFNVTRPPESFVTVSSIDRWYEWKVTDLVSMAMEENYEKITLTLEIIPPSEGMARFASKDQQWREYSPELVFIYLEPKANSVDTRIMVASGLMATVAILFLAYKLLKSPTRKTRPHKVRARPK